ncbi:hypothetical protein C0995_009096 [Termitomyces sp. Mi166|nr:hypothetical protein C0995_009096 [Termitomyces sp. Mi166\
MEVELKKEDVGQSWIGMDAHAELRSIALNPRYPAMIKDHVESRSQCGRYTLTHDDFAFCGGIVGEVLYARGIRTV